MGVARGSARMEITRGGRAPPPSHRHRTPCAGHAGPRAPCFAFPDAMSKRHDRAARHTATADANAAADVAAATEESRAGTPPDGEAGAEVADGGASAEPTDADAAASDDPVALRAELEAQRDRYLRLAAEFDNFRRRTTRERAELGNRAKADLVRPLLDALDDLERFGSVDPATATAASIQEGVLLVGRKLAKALTSQGLEIVNPLDAPFDPALHEALATTPATSAEQDSTVAQVYQLGYVFGGQLVRPARVVVRQWNG